LDVSKRLDVPSGLSLADQTPFGYMDILGMKWNLETVSDLYSRTSNGLKSLCDLRKVDIPMRKNIKGEATRIANARWNDDGR
jgi:hypothetical protein